ncbi:MOB kinase activator 2a isoform X1 [Oncorhynchus keta]|uniref:MOB kinase activator 2a isoform X1 n=1 Tax=Oncorhynchus keta TaxID=8018 RepID=UPI0015F98DEE|nr:MOB kinase activator 2a isoform X1 [Oncorhynchus keta]
MTSWTRHPVPVVTLTRDQPGLLRSVCLFTFQIYSHLVLMTQVRQWRVVLNVLKQEKLSVNVYRHSRKSKTKPNGKKPPAEEKKQYLEAEFTKVRVVDFDLKELVMLPREIDLNEWLASNTTTFFNLINLQYSTISEFCTGDTCQAMTACNTIYYWYDERGKKTKCTAPQYVDFVMSLVQKLVTDDDIFPTKYGKEFPNAFESLVKKICRYLFHVLAHLFWAHFKETVALDLQGHLNTLYAHFIVFIREFNLVDPKETCIMDDLSEILCAPAPPAPAAPSSPTSAPSPSSHNHVTER